MEDDSEDGVSLVASDVDFQERISDEDSIHDEDAQLQLGYEYEFVDEIRPNPMCPVCQFGIRDAVQTHCGHHLCRACLQGILRSDNPVCPVDRKEIQEEGGFFTDTARTREILSLRVKCKHSERGCDWIGEVRHAEEHERQCSYEDTERVVECDFCQEEIYFIEKKEHEENHCKRFPIVCGNNCGHDKIPREKMAEHISDKCLETVVPCSYSSVGCPFEGKRAHLNEHAKAAMEDHLQLLESALEASKTEVKRLKRKVQHGEKSNVEPTEMSGDGGGGVQHQSSGQWTLKSKRGHRPLCGTTRKPSPRNLKSPSKK